MSEETPQVSAIENIELLQPGEFAQFEAAYPVCSYRSASGKYLFGMVVTEEVWLALKQIPKASMLDIVLRFHAGDLDPTKGPHGMFWNRMYVKKVFTSLDLKAALGCDGASEEETKEALKKVFDVTSLTFVSPETFFDWATNKELHWLASIARQQSQYR